MKPYCLLSVCVGMTGAMMPLRAPADEVRVTIRSLSYEPRVINAHVGDSIVWTNGAHSAHTATSDDNGKTFDTGELPPGQTSKPIALKYPGSFGYHCNVHGRTMEGNINVSGPAH
jgi:plastocyanin